MIRVRLLAVLGATATVLGTSTAFAALPPIYQRVAEFDAIVAAIESSPELEAVGEIIAIEYVDVDRYEIRGTLCMVVAHIVTTTQKGPPIVGPRAFTVELDPATCG